MAEKIEQYPRNFLRFTHEEYILAVQLQNYLLNNRFPFVCGKKQYVFSPPAVDLLLKLLSAVNGDFYMDGYSEIAEVAFSVTVSQARIEGAGLSNRFKSGQENIIDLTRKEYDALFQLLMMVKSPIVHPGLVPETTIAILGKEEFTAQITAGLREVIASLNGN